MIFYNGQLFEWKTDPSEEAKEISRTITELESEHFGEDKKGFCQLRYPNGVRVKNKSGLYEPKKQFFLDLVSFDGKWRWSPTMPRNGRFQYKNGNHFKIEDPYLFYKKDIELIWFLKTHCPQFKSGRVYFEDFEEKAKKEANERIENIDIQFAIYSNKSPIAKKLGLLREVADVFGVEGVKKLTRTELKNALYSTIITGEKTKSKYISLKRFEELTDNDAKMRAAGIIRKAIHNGELVFKKSDNTWYTYSDGDYIEALLKLKLSEYSNREHILLEKVLDDKSFKGKVYSELGVSDFTTRAEVEELDYPILLKMCGEEGITLEKGEKKKEDLVKKYCSHLEIES